ncbi:MAG: DUF4178 domain-containing protein [Oscillospiraceae bacterium]|nr:DUF4178 domain-containing protein [Oscillospiraceae bacterium]
MKFQLGDIICADGDQYQVVGRITYQNYNDHCNWDEYRLKPTGGGADRWLSVDDTYQEYSIWEMTRYPEDKTGYHESDRGTEIVVSYEGSGLDVDRGESASFVEYEDETEELLISEERWSDGAEYAKGYYLDEDEIWLVKHDSGYKVRSNLPVICMIGIFILIPVMSVMSDLLSSIHFRKYIAKYVDKSDRYTYVTSITGNDKQKAKVYSTDYTLDAAAKDIIAGIEGDTEYVQQDDEETDGAIAILTAKEYCVIYTSMEGDVLVQVSNRKYAYTTDDDLYHGTSRAHRYYRRFYYSNGYSSDSVSYRNSSSPYSTFDDSGISYSSDNSYSSYSNSIRQSSIASRQSSGGGLSGGK